MKTVSKDLVAKAERLLELVTRAKEIAKEEQELKDYFKANMSESILEAGDVIITLKDKITTTIPKASLLERFGAEVVKELEKVTQSVALSVQKKERV